MKGKWVLRSIVAIVVLLLSSGGILAAPQAQPPDPARVPKAVGLRPVAQGLTSPITLVASPDLSGRRFIVEWQPAPAPPAPGAPAGNWLMIDRGAEGAGLRLLQVDSFVLPFSRDPRALWVYERASAG